MNDLPMRDAVSAGGAAAEERCEARVLGFW